MAKQTIEDVVSKAKASPKKRGRPTLAEQITEAVALATAPLLEKIATLEAAKSSPVQRTGKSRVNPLDKEDGSAMPGSYGYKWTRTQTSGGVPNENFLTIEKATGQSVKPDCVFRAVVARDSDYGFSTNYNPKTNERYMPRTRFERLKEAFKSGAFAEAGKSAVEAMIAEFGEPITERGQQIAAFYRS